jgi:hypothetical protein
VKLHIYQYDGSDYVVRNVRHGVERTTVDVSRLRLLWGVITGKVKFQKVRRG